MSQPPGQWGQQPQQGGQPGWPPQQGQPQYPQQPQQPQQPPRPQQPQQGQPAQGGWGQQPGYQGGYQQPAGQQPGGQGGYQPQGGYQQGGYQQGGYQGQPGGYGGGGQQRPPGGSPGSSGQRSPAMIIGIVVAAVVLLVAVGGIIIALNRSGSDPNATITPTNTAPPTEDPSEDPTEDPSEDPSEQPSSSDPSESPGGGGGEQVDLGNGVAVTIPSGWSDLGKKGDLQRYSNGTDTWTGQTAAGVSDSVATACDGFMKQIAEDMTNTKFQAAKTGSAGTLDMASCGVSGTVTGNGGSGQLAVTCTMALDSDGKLGVSTVYYGSDSDLKQLQKDYDAINGSMVASMS